MGKSAGVIAIVCLFGCLVCRESVVGNGDIGNNVVAPVTIVCVPDIREKLVDTLLSYLHVKELTGNNDGPEVEMFIAASGLDPKGQYPWCAAFISYIYQANGLAVPGYSARAAAWFVEPYLIPDKEAIGADLGSLYYANLGRIGHVFMYLEPYKNSTPYVVTGEGNTNAQGSREGNQVARRFRLRGTVHSSAKWVK